MKYLRKHIKQTGFLAAGLLSIGAMLLAPISAAAAPSTLVNEPFTGTATAADAWLYGDDTCLTGASSSAAHSIPACPGPDSDGTGVLRLTPLNTWQDGYAIYNQPVSSKQGLHIEFDQYQYGGGGADGISFFLIDGSGTPAGPGAYGRGLGYASSTDNGGQPGIVGGYVGVGFDAGGNFSAIGTGTGGMATAQLNHIAIRGSAATNYQYVTGVEAAGSLRSNSSNRADAKRHVVITINPQDIMTVSVDYGDGNGLVPELTSVNLNTINGGGAIPPTFKFGFAGSTGTVDDIHEIGNLVVTTLPPDLSLAAQTASTYRADADGQVGLTVANAADAGPTTGTISVSATLPAGVRPEAASGSGWSCTVSGQSVHCSRSGSGTSALAAGASLPPIALTLRPLAGTTGNVSFTAGVTTGDDSDAANDTVSVRLNIGPASAPDTGYGTSAQPDPIIMAAVIGAVTSTAAGLALLYRRKRTQP